MERGNSTIKKILSDVCAERKKDGKSDNEGCMEDKWCMETRFTSFNKVNYIKYMNYECHGKPEKNGRFKA